MAGIKRGPWTIHQSKTIYDNPWMKIEEFDVTRPDGSVGIYGVMEPKNFAIGVLPLFANGDTILVGQYRFAVDAHSWELPEGGGPRDIDPLISAQRELEEETGYTAKDWLNLGQCDLSNSLTSERGEMFLAWNLRQTEANREASEADMVEKRVPLNDVLMMMLEGEIKDAFTHIIVHRAIAMARTGRLDPTVSKLIVKAIDP
jgi:8-oxo-dGTP pyrophosphatase MutT (NUDIX family)